MRLDELKLQALRYLALGDFTRALRLYERVVAAVPTDLDARTRIGDVCVQIGQRDLARRVYAAVAYYDIQGGRALHAVVAIQLLVELGEDATQLRSALAALYGAGSERIAHGRIGARLSPPAPDQLISPPDLTRAVGLEEAALAAAAVAADTRMIAAFPETFPPVPLLSDLSDRAFDRVLATAIVQRLGHGANVIRAGDPGEAFYLLAAGEARVFVGDGGGQRELARLHEGALFGEMALIHAQPRSASVEVVGSADLLAFDRRALHAAADELPAVAQALERFSSDRLVKNLLGTSPLFQPFTPKQRLDLIKRFAAHQVSPGVEILVAGRDTPGLYVLLSGGVEVVRGEPPFETVLATLGPGECFGEIGLLREQPAMATVRATRLSTVLFLSREYFARLTEVLPEIRQLFEQISDERLRAVSWSDPTFLDEPLR